MEPIPESRVLLDLLWTGDERLEDWLLTRAQQVVAAIPGCVGITVALRRPLEATFTLVATAEWLRVIDAAQYLAGGPCEEVADQQEPLEADLFSEPRWQLVAQAGAAGGVSSSLSFPIRSESSQLVGSVNLYGAGRDTFDGPPRDVARLFGAGAHEAVANGDLPMSGLDRARRSTQTVQHQVSVDIAAGLLAEREQLAVTEARQRLDDAAERAGLPVTTLAEVVLQHYSGGSNV